jgi:hypothetical protein
MYPDPIALVSQGFEEGGFGASQANDIATLQKALSAGHAVNNPGTAPGEGFPLRVESLEQTMKLTTFEADEIKLFKQMPKLPATNTVEEFNRLLDYSAGGANQFDQGFMSEGDLPEEQDTTYERAHVLIKFLGAVGRVTHVANTVRGAHGNVVATETQAKTMFLLQQLEHALFFGDSTLIPTQFDGLNKLIVDGSGGENVVDLRGGKLTENILNDGFRQIRDNFGAATDFYCATGPFSRLADELRERQRAPFGAEPGVLGAVVRAFQGQHGKANLHDHIFIRPGGRPVATGIGATAKRPAAPTITVAPAEAVNAASKFVVADAGTYFYRVVAGNKYGRSAPVNTAGVTIAAGESVTFTVQDNSGPGVTTYYEIYRTKAGEAVATADLMTKVARTGATQVVTDHNDDIPGTSTAFLLMQNQQSFSWAQLLPMLRIPLAQIDTSIRWAQVIYGAIKMYTPRKNLIFKNVA